MSLELQEFIFERNPKRRDLFGYEAQSTSQKRRVQVFRNHSFELVEHTITAYLDYAELPVEFTYSGYDDSFSFADLDDAADLVIIWADGGRYSNPLQSFLPERVSALKQVYQKSVLVITFRGDVTVDLPDVAVWNLSELAGELGDKLIDERAAAATGTSLSSKAMLLISKELGLRLLPSLLRPALKGIVVDFDNTLYQGVLGEDSVNGVVLTEGHVRLQKKLKELSGQGFFLCAASKNELTDVLELLERRADFPLKKSDFSKLCVSWNPKADSIAEIAAYLNIHTDALVLVDDNIGELTAVQMVHPQIKVIHAKENADITCQVLQNFPGLLKTKATVDDAIRKADVQAKEGRLQLQQTLSQEDYVRSLQLHLRYDMDNREQIIRVSELANKTNQFIFNYKRYTQSQVERLMEGEDSVVLTMTLSDRLSDSGLIGVFVGVREGSALVLEECFVSCRALGRGIDEVMVLHAIQLMLDRFGLSEVQVQFTKGPRNAPAEKLVTEKLADYCMQAKPFRYELPEDLLTVEVRN